MEPGAEGGVLVDARRYACCVQLLESGHAPWCPVGKPHAVPPSPVADATGHAEAYGHR